MSVITPHAEVIVWNYKQRFSADKLSDPSGTEEPFVLGNSVIKISTNKTKAQPTGGFEIQLAPTHNWIARITPGSWCAILMSPVEKINITPNNVGSAKETTLKMMGRIDSVRTVVGVNQEGTRTISYIVTGMDWGSVFETHVFIDPLVLSSGLLSLGAIGVSQALAYSEFVTNLLSSGKAPSTTDNIKGLIKIWENTSASVATNIAQNVTASAGVQLTSGVQYLLPDQVAKFLNLKSPHLAKAITLVSGVLTDYDTYKDVVDANGFIMPNSIIGEHTLWQLLNDHSNNIINELVAELRWPENECQFTLYKRARPFLLRPLSTKAPEATKNASMMKHVKCTKISTTDVVNFNAGTNWRDSINFIEVMPEIPLKTNEFYNSEAKGQAQISDLNGFARDGFRARMLKTPFVIFNYGSKQSIDKAVIAPTQWKHLLKEWYFNTQGLLNGSLTCVGQPHYIAVGDNIQIDANALGLAPISSFQKGDCFLLAHIESVSHNFTIDSDGTRQFMTNIKFVRGHIVNENKEPVDPNSGMAIDKDAAALSEAAERLPNIVWSQNQ